jgi:hypothetical protein
LEIAARQEKVSGIPSQAGRRPRTEHQLKV